MPLVIWFLHLGPGAERLRGRSRVLALVITILVSSIGLLACIYFSFQLAHLGSLLLLNKQLVFEGLTLSSLIGFGILGFTTIIVTYDWSRHYDVPALKHFAKRFGLIALAVVSANVATKQLMPTAETPTFFASLFLMGLVALSRVERIRKRTERSPTRESSSRPNPMQ